jgi:hypothetical protein
MPKPFQAMQNKGKRNPLISRKCDVCGKSVFVNSTSDQEWHLQAHNRLSKAPGHHNYPEQ